MNRVKELFLYPLTGLYNECHEINYEELLTTTTVRPDNKHCLKSLNNLWWHDAFSDTLLETIIERLQTRYLHSSASSLHHKAVLSCPENFIKSVQQAPKTIADLGAGSRKLFGALESLQIFCNLYSDLISTPFVLSLQEGLVVNELSSLILVQEALNPATNPYLDFIERHYLPILHEVKPTLLWIVGPIKMSSFAMAMLARKYYPSCHISVTGHSTEYYSLNKITKHLKHNSVLFSVIDSIVLDDFENTVPQVIECLRGGHSLESVPNLLYVDRKNKNTIQNSSESINKSLVNLVPAKVIEATPVMEATQTLEYQTYYHSPSTHVGNQKADSVDPSNVIDIKLWPNAKCYWNHCNFCAINRKYTTLPKNSFSDAEQIADYLAEVSRKGVKYVWSFDEAAPPKALGELAQQLLEKKVDILWQTRSKIDRNFTPEICSILGQSGLREIRLGLESASPRILSSMGKFPPGWSLDLIEQVVSQFHNSGVSVHFPTIIGFPTETDDERLETFSFLEYIVQKYPSVTFNMNVLGFDIASKLYENYEEFGITSVRWPAPAKYFLGNLLDWDCDEVPFNYEYLDHQRNTLMKRLLYPWMPSTAAIPAYIFYRLSETSRSTMVWKANRYETNNWLDVKPSLSDFSSLKLSPTVTITQLPDHSLQRDKRYFIYDWESHHTMECSQNGAELLFSLREEKTLIRILNDFTTSAKSESEIEELLQQVQELYEMDIIHQSSASSQRLITDQPFSEVSEAVYQY